MVTKHGIGVDSRLAGILESKSQLLAQVTLTAAQILALHTAPVTVVPGVTGKVIVLHHASVDFDAGSVAFTGGGAAHLKYATSGADAVNSANMPAFTGASSHSSLTPSDATGMLDGDSLVITNATANFGGSGNGTATVNVWYSLV